MNERPKLAALTAGYLALAAFNCVLLLSYLGSHPGFPGDFCAFYTGARIYMQDPSRVYDLTLQRATEQPLIGRDDIPFNHPPYELLLWLPLARLSFPAAFWVWRFASLVLLAIASKLLASALCPRLGASAIFLRALAFFPVPYCLWMGQDSVLLLAILAACAWLLARRMEWMAGAALGLALFKPQLILPIAAIYLLLRRWRMLRGFLCSGLAVLAVSILMVGYAGMRQMVTILSQGQTAAHMAIHPSMMPNLRGLLAMLLAGHSKLEAILVGAISVGLLLCARATTQRQQPPARAFAGLVCFAILVSFHLNLHDLALLLLPILLVIEDRMWSGANGWQVTAPLIVLFCTPAYLVALGAFKVAVFALFVGWLWYGMARCEVVASRQPVSSIEERRMAFAR
ncbi:MAG: glycosyltransferase family 87 protein [Candidatus Korobacteraceae bacterium]|jgi:glycosyl transferase family 87